MEQAFIVFSQTDVSVAVRDLYVGGNQFEYQPDCWLSGPHLSNTSFSLWK
jgi:hypothetical protein